MYLYLHFLKHTDMKKTAVKDSPTQLKHENVVQEGMAQLQLNEENTTTPKPEERKMHSAVVFTRPFKFTIPCKVCGVVGHLNDSCPYMTLVWLSSGSRNSIETTYPHIPQQNGKTAVKDSPTQLKNENVVQEGMAQLQLNEENTTTPKPEERKMHRAVVFTRPFKFTIPCKVCGKTAVKDSPTQLKKETDVQEGMAQLQLEENTTTLKPKERKMSSAVVCTRPFKFTIPCKVCAVVGHSNDKCPYMKQSDGSGTALVAIVLSSGVAMAVESRITSLPPLTKTLYPQHKLHIIRDDPPVLAGWCHSNIEGMALINHLKGNAKKKNLKNIVKLGRDYLSTKTERFNVQCYVCSVERGEPLAYIINRFWDTLHLPECDPDAECDSNGCQCTRFKIELNTRQLKFGVYCIGSGAKFAFADLKSSFEGKEDVRSQTGEYNIENLDKGGDFTLDDVGKMLLSAVFEAALHNADCGGPFWVSSIPRFGSIAPQPPCDFVNAYKLFYADLELRHETYIFVIYREGLVGNNYGHFIVQNA
ncbi:hypothetical protein D8674_030215 [Pyrus ussuriensis x Pyrus communis]|uniref:CCHC-type domain-containing protein n=1 Tax=Pyrus ussuriensis x Pyrus communis TaxID=2448454 RepID=A0A5N5EVE6_9ROSA|nr:hypothetical protein D8674_030215 [Pyrus ussuriensis x Pyrus communis]